MALLLPNAYGIVNTESVTTGYCAPVYTPKVNEFQRSAIVAEFVRGLIHERQADGEPFRDIGRAIGCSGPHASNIEKGKAGVGPKLERSIAKAWFGGSTDALLDAALKAWKKSGRTLASAGAPREPLRRAYTREDAFRIAAQIDGIAEHVVDRVVKRAASDGKQNQRIVDMLNMARSIQDFEAGGETLDVVAVPRGKQAARLRAAESKRSR